MACSRAATSSLSAGWLQEKGAHHLIRAFRQLNPDCHLVIAGEARGEAVYRRELQALAGDDPRIHWPGAVEGRLLDELFSHALLFVQPSEMEGLPLCAARSHELWQPVPGQRSFLRCEKSWAIRGCCSGREDEADLAAKLQRPCGCPTAGARSASGPPAR